MAATAARTPAACRIAGLEQSKFNDLMASKEYTCAPPATPGVARIFEMPDLIGLYVFTRLIERGRTVPQASTIACQIVGKLRESVNNTGETPDHIAIAYSLRGSSFLATVEKDEDGKRTIDPFASNFGGGGAMHDILETEVWNIANVRREVEKGLAEESRIVG